MKFFFFYWSVFWLVLIQGHEVREYPMDARLQKIFREVLLSYPELQEKEVTLVFKTNMTSLMHAQPVIESFFSKSLEYRVRISADVEFQSFLRELSVEEFRGWFAHELGHIADYEDRGRLGTLWLGILYLVSPTTKRQAEEIADHQAISHGHGHGLICGVQKMLSSKHISGESKKSFLNFYLHPFDLYRMQREFENRIKTKK